MGRATPSPQQGGSAAFGLGIGLGLGVAMMAAGFHAAPVLSAEVPPVLVTDLPGYNPLARGEAGTVRSRPRPDFDAEGLPLGQFRLRPSLAVSSAYDSNILRAPDDERADLIGRAAPAFRLESDWSRHALALSARADLGIYAENDSENYTDAGADLVGTIDIRSGLRLDLSAGYLHGHEARGSVDEGGGAEPTLFDRIRGAADLTARTGRFRYHAGLAVTQHDYDDVARVGGGTINHDDRDSLAYGGVFRMSYEALPEARAFVSGEYTIIDFASPLDDSGVNRDGDAYGIVAGADASIGGITFGRLYAGWIGQSFDDSSLSPVSGFSAGGQVTSNITPLTTVEARFARDLRATVTANANTIVQTEGEARIDHELLRNLLIHVAFGGRRLSFRGIDRTDDHIALGLGANWLINRYARLSFGYGFDVRRSGGVDAAGDWQRHLLSIQLLLQR